MNYTVYTGKNQEKKPNTWIYFQFCNDSVIEELGSLIPYPHKHYVNEKQGTYTYCWLLDGFFETNKGIEHLNDIIARFILTFPDCKYIKHYKDSTSNIKPIKLKAFYNLKSKVEKQKSYVKADVQFDTVFWVLKYYSEDLIRENGFIMHDKLYSYAVEHFINKAKDKSTLKAKCRNIWNWYSNRDWKIGRENRKYETKEELMASRSTHMKNINKAKGEEAKRKVLNCITGLYSEEYKKKDGSWFIKKIVEDSGVSRNIVAKYVKEYNQPKGGSYKLIP